MRPAWYQYLGPRSRLTKGLLSRIAYNVPSSRSCNCTHWPFPPQVASTSLLESQHRSGSCPSRFCPVLTQRRGMGHTNGFCPYKKPRSAVPLLSCKTTSPQASTSVRASSSHQTLKPDSYPSRLSVSAIYCDGHVTLWMTGTQRASRNTSRGKCCGEISSCLQSLQDQTGDELA